MKAFAFWTKECEAMAPFPHHRTESAVLSDPGIPTLDAVFDPTTMEKYLREILPHLWGAIENVEFQILKHHPGSRCTFEVAWRTPNGRRCLIGKVYAADRPDVYRAMEEIWRAGFGPQEEFSIPEPLAYCSELHLLLQEKIQGLRAKHVLLSDNARDRAEASERCARWLARFHAIGPRLGAVYRLDNHLDTLAESSRFLAALGSPFADKAPRLGERLKATARALGTIELRAGHGHYSCGQVLLAGRRTVTLDWDGYHVADPCRDVASFLVKLKRMGLKSPGAVPALERAAEVFLKTYTTLATSHPASHLAFQEAAICLTRANHDMRKQGPVGRERAAATLDEGLRLLEQGA